MPVDIHVVCENSCLFTCIFAEFQMAHRSYGKWTREDLQRAVPAINRGDLWGLSESSRMYGVPKATLSRHMTGKNKIADGDTTFHGHVCALPQDVEAQLVQHCLALESMYLGCMWTI